ncbi:glycoside hydrolase [Alkalispirochaeta sphaeroplastigenens]|uniref:Glycoside hydrolase n=1 Tax=Alkalispirochaeta sphaeroplastigenens TaxID=1187066 RepID=A0A2S4JR99_9SPIO|nr:glycosyl hydrolase family 65 protein [Alkalispirochaeta sphaeroplastigenens]POR02041.1 glycoside hydrolase [Alkalispirochaeta sphaeroplastigenens]
MNTKMEQRVELSDEIWSETCWEIGESRFDPDQAVTAGSNFMIGNGYMGYRGTFADDRADQYPALVVTDTYDNADGTWKELVTAPNGLFTLLSCRGKDILWRQGGFGEYERRLNMLRGEWSARARWDDPGILVEEERFCSYDDLHLLTSRTRITALGEVELEIATGIDGKVWSLNGNHFSSLSLEEGPDCLEASCVTGEQGYHLVLREDALLRRAGGAAIEPCETASREGALCRVFRVSLEEGQALVLEKRVVLYSSNDLRDTSRITSDAARGPLPTQEEVRQATAGGLSRAVSRSWEELREAHRNIWKDRWDSADILIGGDRVAQTLIRYNLYHNVIAAPAHADHLPLGARGLSCQAYQGAAFWDQEIFNLPMFLFTDPETARRLLVYRYRTLDGARKKARDLGYRGAFYAWVSGDTGEEICPSWFFRDVLTGRRIRNHFNDWQIHVSPDIAYTVWKYVTATGDQEFLELYGAEILFEVARFLASRVHYRPGLERYEIIRVLGPDEYHENVDNNYFTNFQAQFVCRYAVEVYDSLSTDHPRVFDDVARRIGLERGERDAWDDIARRIYIPEADHETGLIEQFQGFFELEDTRPEVIRERLLDPGEYWGWPNGIAVETQVSKQADVTQLFMLHPKACSREVIRANWEYYEPRTQHGSSLSYAVYAICAAWIGHDQEAYRYFLRSCTVDLLNTGKAVSGGTFIGGIHTAACGVAWQIVVSGFAGMYLTRSGFGFDPHLPSGWETLAFTLKRWGDSLEVTLHQRAMTVRAREDNSREITLEVGSSEVALPPGQQVAVPLR